jgi:Cu-Zn family superoxide dismutase
MAASSAKKVSKKSSSSNFLNKNKKGLLLLVALLFIAVGTAAVLQANAAAPLAKATLLNAAGAEIGQVVFKGPGEYADRVEVKLNAAAAPNLGSFHGFHVHATGVCNPSPSGATNVPFGSSGGHWNPGNSNHGAHAGDLPSVLLTAQGKSYAEFETDRFDITSLLDAAGDGSAVVLHAGADNFANIPAVYGAPNTATLGTGDAGGRYACGVVKAVN